ncbi:Cytochrome C oxidase subunit II [Candidatus Hydrogenisulfobacillus filiaventi]|uniref:cytochrome-c oxidase n=1 Tax=Candidatus Hydrogenisulfobacillus filiaventi TaxID=2707344 RepID=A0A6F8ZGS1_9FIRM|nr:cytochrome c oxidase subunit II [Bacillota bacterium]CAB1129140.1 Cytochrome C oxidase subunit II [Candidatus Hydrogenisulfobacillus filiaventi]
MDYVVFGVLWVVFTVLAELGVQDWVHHGPYYFTASQQAIDGQRAFDFIITVLTPIAVFVILMLVYVMIRFRARRGETGDAPVQFRYNRAYVSLWVLLTLGVNLLLFIHPTASAMETVFAAALPQNNRHDLVVDVTARQWQWIFSYPQYGLTQTVSPTSGHAELELPVDRKVKFVLRSYDPFHQYDYAADVIHSFWIPAFGIKEDVIPGETRYEYINPTRIASYATNPMMRVQCAEVCGPGHPWMEAEVNVVSPAAFKAWVAKEKAMQGS